MCFPLTKTDYFFVKITFSSLVLHLLAVFFFCLFLALTWWQYQRGSEKQLRLDQLNTLAQSVPLTAAEIPVQQRAGLDLRPAVMIPQQTRSKIFLDNRTRQGKAGLEVLQPIRIPSGWLLVNLGWQQWSRSSPMPDSYAEMPLQQITGLLRHWPEKGFTLGEQEYTQKIPVRLLWLDRQALSVYFDAPILPYVLYIDGNDPQALTTDWHITGSTPPLKHYAYAFQWLAMAFVILVLLFLFHKKRRRQH